LFPRTFLVNGFSIFDERVEGKPNLIFVPYFETKVEEEKKEENPLQFLDGSEKISLKNDFTILAYD
jgi:hypothetical protein